MAAGSLIPPGGKPTLHRLRIPVLLLPPLCGLLLSPPPCLGQGRGFSAGMATRFDWWLLRKVESSHWPYPKDWSVSDLESGSAGPGVMAGPQVSYRGRRWGLTGTLLASRARDFDVTLTTDRVEPVLEPSQTSGRARLGYAAFDLRYGGLFGGIVGFRRLAVTVPSWESGQYRSHARSDVVIGGSFEASRDPNWSVALQAVFSATVLRYGFDKEASAEHGGSGELFVDVGYAPRSAPIAVCLGLGVLAFDKFDRTYDVGFSGNAWDSFSDAALGLRWAVLWAP